MTAISRSQSKGAVDMGCHSLPRSNMAGPTLSHQRLHKACEFVFAADQKACFLGGVMERSCAATTVKRHTAVMRSYRILSASYSAPIQPPRPPRLFVNDEPSNNLLRIVSLAPKFSLSRRRVD